ncbi:hypothetical protein EVAR_12859_1 [Eumeta japonica]|uniref:Uncharacterized protein n=1 Tax=Eumeta variegata TaxID=151549 RepID=A0A4C1TVL5_EUMVA|nr:hypothetical protein EVAR_12859_1 [Eumeta japonica]
MTYFQQANEEAGHQRLDGHRCPRTFTIPEDVHRYLAELLGIGCLIARDLDIAGGDTETCTYCTKCISENCYFTSVLLLTFASGFDQIGTAIGTRIGFENGRRAEPKRNQDQYSKRNRPGREFRSRQIQNRTGVGN